jgi:preprotein translocase subunit SecG
LKFEPDAVIGQKGVLCKALGSGVGEKEGVKMTVKKLMVFFVSIFFAFSLAMDIRAEEKLQEEAPAVDIRAEEKPQEEAPAMDIKAEEKPQEETPAIDIKAEEKPQKEAPAMDIKAEEKPQKEAPESSGLLQKIEKLERDMAELKKEAEVRRKEAGAREKLAVTEEEKTAKEAEILTAADRRYTLRRSGTVGLDYNFGYSYYSVDRIAPFDIEHEKKHALTHTISVDYAFYDNLTFTGALPFVYKYENVGVTDSKEVSDVGDISFGFRWQPFKSGGEWPATILSGSVGTPTGASPYAIDTDRELSTGSGFWSFTGGASASKTLDPVVAFGGLSYTYILGASGLSYKYSTAVLEKVEPGASIGFNMGLGYALSYNVSLNLGFSQSYTLGSTYYFENGSKISTAASMSSSFSIGTGWRINPKTTVSIGASIGLTNNDPDFSLSFRLPFNF